MTSTERGRALLVLGVFGAVFLFLTVSSYTRKSATVDEPLQLTAGLTALRLQDYRVDVEHPPLLRLWAALPLSVMGVQVDTNTAYWLPIQSGWFSHELLYERQDADRLLYPARFMIVLLGLGLGVLLFCWAYELFGFWPATIALGLYSFEPNILAHTGLVTTDLGVTFLMFGALYFLWRTGRHLTWGNLLGTVLFFSLSQAGKFSALLLGPIFAVLLLTVVCHRAPWPSAIRLLGPISSRARKLATASGFLGLLVAVTVITLWAVYGFRYAPAPPGSGLRRIECGIELRERVPLLAATVNWIDQRRLLPNAYTQGFLVGQGLAQKRTAFLAGQYSNEGWWYYFPLCFLIKTPIGLLGLFLAGSSLCLRRASGSARDNLFLLVPLVCYLGMAMTAKINIGLRHLLPIYPLVILLGAKAVHFAGQQRRKTIMIAAGALGLFHVEESAFAYPHYLAFFNQTIGGPRNGYRYLSDSNIDWGQDLKPLKRWMDARGIRHINLSYFGNADPSYYGLNCTYLPGSPRFAEDQIAPPVLPGFVAVSVHNLHGVVPGYFRRDFYRSLLALEPDAVIGYSIHVYWIDRLETVP